MAVSLCYSNFSFFVFLYFFFQIYSLVPPKVERFQVSRLSSSEVTLTWQKIPVFQSGGVILSYRLGFFNETAGSA